jgi:hypothetical protein
MPTQRTARNFTSYKYCSTPNIYYNNYFCDCGRRLTARIDSRRYNSILSAALVDGGQWKGCVISNVHTSPLRVWDTLEVFCCHMDSRMTTGRTRTTTPEMKALTRWTRTITRWMCSTTLERLQHDRRAPLHDWQILEHDGQVHDD